MAEFAGGDRITPEEVEKQSGASIIADMMEAKRLARKANRRNPLVSSKDASYGTPQGMVDAADFVAAALPWTVRSNEK